MSKVVKKRLDYQPSAWSIKRVSLVVELDPVATRVTATTQLSRNQSEPCPLKLDGLDQKLISIKVNGSSHQQYELLGDGLLLDDLPASCELEVQSQINPEANSSLEGLYLSQGAYCTQCEAEGFRKITYFLDRPDILSIYDVTIYAEKQAFPYLLSNGNKVDAGGLSDGRHWVRWHDPHPKPCYLFALVAGDFDRLDDHFITASGNKVELVLFVDKGKQGRGRHALDSLKKAMAWDEQKYGLEYDLDIYMIVAVDFFNMGAMENKSLNVFNSKFVLADANTATDEDYFNIESVIAHEYFHNWTGNRVTCRDWFQLSLKEGLTVFRDQQFSADMSSPLSNRIKQIRVMREHQFAEDAGPMSHPIRPDEVLEMNNFYTVTVYDKGAEVIRMLHTLLGEQKFRRGMELYFERHDGQAVTCDDFVQAMQDASEVDLVLFRRWYSQSGTPTIEVQQHYDAQKRQYHLHFTQLNSPTADQSHKQPLHIPIKLDLILGNTGKDNRQALFSLTENQDTLVLEDVTQPPICAILADFSAPVKVDFAQSVSERITILKHASDAVSRWEASQQLYAYCIQQRYFNMLDGQAEQALLTTLREMLDSQVDLVLMAEVLRLPSFETLLLEYEQVDIDALHSSCKAFKCFLAEQLQGALNRILPDLTKQYCYQQQQVHRRTLADSCLSLLALLPQSQNLLHTRYFSAVNMTESMSVLKATQQASLSLFEALMADFEQKWQQEPLVLDKWFALHASCERDDSVEHIQHLQEHLGFDWQNPNRVRSLLGSFAFYNPIGFHQPCGQGYRLVTDYLLKLDEINPQVASRIVTPLTQWKNLDLHRQQLIKLQLSRLAEKPGLSDDLREKVTKSLC